MNSDEEYTAIQRAEVLNELRAYLDKSHAPGAYKMMVDALEADANRLAALTRPPSDEEVGNALAVGTLLETFRAAAVAALPCSDSRRDGAGIRAIIEQHVQPLLSRLSHQLSEAREKALGGETIKTVLDLLNPLHGSLDKQTYDERLRANFDAPPDAEYAVDVTAKQERDLTQAVCILENRLRALKSSDETKK